MALVVNGKPVLYICPYCKAGRFTADDGWDGAVTHIRERHHNVGGRALRHSDVADADPPEDAEPPLLEEVPEPQDELLD